MGDYGYGSRGECAVPTVHRFHSPSHGNGLVWYSFNVGPIHIIYSSTEQDLRPVYRSRPPYDRSCPTYRRTCVLDGTTHVLNGMVG